MSQEALEHFLTHLTGEVESSSEFTLDPDSALEKLAAHQLPAPGLWAVKLVQGAVAQEARMVSFAMEKTRLRFECHQGGAVSAFHLLRQICSGQWPERSSERHWVTGLRGAYGRKLPSLSWASTVGGQRESVTISEAGIETAVSPAPRVGNAVTFEVVAQYPSSLLNRASACADEYAALCKACRLSSMPVYVDTRKISQQPPESTGSAYYNVVWESRAGDEEESFCLHLWNQRLALAHGGEPPLIFQRLEPGERKCALLLTAAPCDSLTRAKVSWIKDGVLLGPYSLTFRSRMKFQIVLPGDHLQTDLSEWALRKTQRTLPVSEILSVAREVLAKLEANPTVNPPPRDLATTLIYGFGEVCAWIGLNALALGFCSFPSADPLGWQKARRDNANLLSAMRALAAQETLELESGL